MTSKIFIPHKTPDRMISELTAPKKDEVINTTDLVFAAATSRTDKPGFKLTKSIFRQIPIVEFE